MSISVKDGQLGRTIRSAEGKLVAIDFSNPGCGPCRAIHPWWESLVTTYKTVVFCTVMCDECPTEASEYRIRATPTFVFIHKGKEVARFEGADKKDKILAVIEQYKGAGGFSGSGHTLGGGAPQGDFFAQLQAQRDAKLAGQPAPAQPQASLPGRTPSGEVPTRQARTMQPPPAPAAPQVDPAVKEQMLEMGFEEALVEEAFRATVNRGSTIDAMLEYIERKQNQPHTVGGAPQPAPQPAAPAGPAAPAAPAGPAGEPVQSGKQQQVANDLMKPLDEAGEAAKAQLVSMGYDGELAQMAINVAGPQNIDGCIDIIGKIERGEPIPMPKHRLTQQELDEKVAHYRELLAKKRAEEYERKEAPKAKAKSEIERRKEVLENLEQKKKLEEMKREQAIRDAQKEKIREKIEREKVRQRIAAQRAAQKSGGQHVEAAPAQPAAAAAPPPKSSATECTLKLAFPDGTSVVHKFQPTQTLAHVEAFLKSSRSDLQYRNIGFETTFPRRVVTRAEYSKSMVDLQLMPRAQLNVIIS